MKIEKPQNKEICTNASAYFNIGGVRSFVFPSGNLHNGLYESIT